MIMMMSRIRKIIPRTMAAMVPVVRPLSSVAAPILAEKRITKHFQVNTVNTSLKCHKLVPVNQMFCGSSSRGRGLSAVCDCGIS